MVVPSKVVKLDTCVKICARYMSEKEFIVIATHFIANTIVSVKDNEDIKKS